jgi:FtsH-binding integral membrane protein
MTIDLPRWLLRVASHTRLLRGVAATLAAGCAVVYFLIGLGIIYDPHGNELGLLVFGFSAGLAFTLGVLLLVATERRTVWFLGALFQVFVIIAYVQVSSRREPPFEIWGISLKIAQAAILAALLGLLLSSRRADSTQIGVAPDR